METAYEDKSAGSYAACALSLPFSPAFGWPALNDRYS